MVSEVLDHSHFALLLCVSGEAEHHGGEKLFSSWWLGSTEREEGAWVPISLSRVCPQSTNFFQVDLNS
jgi:hypothetical protein